MQAEADQDAAKIAELSAIVQAVRERVRTRYPEPSVVGAGVQDAAPVRVRIADLMPIVHARDAAQARIAAIGSVNPRSGGVVNRIIQTVKKTVARGLGWFVRDQVVFNREVVAGFETVIEALNEHNRTLVQIAAQTSEALVALRRHTDESLVATFEPLKHEAGHLRDLGQHWNQWRAGWEAKLSANEIHFLRSIAEMQGANQHRASLMESNFRANLKAQHDDYKGALDRANEDIQKRLWGDMEKLGETIRREYDRLIHDELRIIRMRAQNQPAVVQHVEPAVAQPALDYTRFAYRFRGTEDDVRKSQEYYKPYYSDRNDVLDIGCGRGEFLEAMRELGVRARGIDLSEESVAQCRGKGLDAERADLFPFLEAQPEGAFDGIFSSQVVEHIEAARLPEVIRLCASRLRRGGVLTIETPNPECLAIFATYFYLDPTHTRPVPYPLLEFYMKEYGLGAIEIRRFSPAVESWPEIAELPEKFRERFFGGLDYAIIGRKL